MLFRKLGILTIVTVYLLILAGGIVRSTGSGMGCPDWPKCFGSWIPPTQISQLPANYAEVYGAKLKGEVVFNATKTWIEYINRLLGVLTGVFIFGTLLASIPFLKKDKSIFWTSFLSFILVGFQGWLGSKVVSTELKPIMVTIHMLVAVLIVFILLYAVARAYQGQIQTGIIQSKSHLNRLLVIIILVSMLQVLFGTQVREGIDEIALRLQYTFRDTWVDSVGLPFYIHRSFSLVVLALHAYLIAQLTKNVGRKSLLSRCALYMVVLVGIEIATGIGMAYAGIPAFLQPIHLTLAIVMLGVQFVTWLFLNEDKVFKMEKI